MIDLTKVYGRELPAMLKEIGNTKAMQRLKGVGMACGCEFTSIVFFADRPIHTRYTHSLSTASIVWNFSHNIEQAVAALLHDVATPAFSHAIDFFYQDHMHQEATEDKTREVIYGSEEILGILQAAGIDPEAVCDYHRYPIADNPSPRLSADRLEYSLSDMVKYGFATLEDVKRYYEDLSVGTNEEGEPELSFMHADIAAEFASNALKNGEIYASDANRICMQSMADLMHKAVNKNVLTEKDFYRTESDVIKKLTEGQMKKDWERYRRICGVKRKETGETDSVYSVIPTKKRYIDPFVQNCGKRLSEVDSEFGRKLLDFRDITFDQPICAEYLKLNSE